MRLLVVHVGLFCLFSSASLITQGQVVSEVDTLSPLSFETCLGDSILWVTPGVGPVFGNNLLWDREKAQQLLLPSPGNGFVTGGIVYWGAKKVGANGEVRLKAWSVAPDGSPESFLTASEKVRISALDTALGYTYFSFPAPAAFTGSVFLRLDLGSLNAGDTVNVFGTRDSCGSGCVAWERWSDGSWNPVCDTYNFLDVDMLVQAIVDWTPWPLGVEGPEQHGQAIVGRLYPLPATSAVSVPIRIEQPQSLAIQLVDLSGKERSTYSFPSLAKGDHILELAMSGLPVGFYLLRIQGEAFQVTRSVVLSGKP